MFNFIVAIITCEVVFKQIDPKMCKVANIISQVWVIFPFEWAVYKQGKHLSATTGS